MGSLVHETETKKESEMRQAFQNVLRPGETLLEYSPVPVKFRRIKYWLGMSDRRFLLIWPRNRGWAYSIYFAYIESVAAFSKEPGAPNPELKITLRRAPKGHPLYRLSLQVDGGYTPALQQMAERFNQLAGLPQHAGLSVTLQQAKDLRDMSLWDVATSLLDRGMQVDPVLAANGEIRELKRAIVDTRLGITLAYALVFGLFIIFFIAEFIKFSDIFFILSKYFPLYIANCSNFFIAFLLLSKHKIRRILAAVLIITSLAILLLFPEGLPVVQVVLILILFLAQWLMVVKPNRKRILTGLLVYIFGVGGGLAFAFLAPARFPEAVDFLSFKPATPFLDNLQNNSSTDPVWIKVGSDTFYAGRDAFEGAWLHELSPQRIDFYFPPATYFFGRGEVTVRPADEYFKNEIYSPGGYFGLACRWGDQGGRYDAVLFDPLKLEFAIARKTAAASQLQTGAWLPAAGMKPGNHSNRIGLSCQGDTLAVTLNGATLLQQNDPAMAGLGRGQMGLMLVTTADLTDKGFQMIFSDASFWTLQ